MTRMPLLACLFAVLALTVARADIPPPPGSEERHVAQMIGQQGHACPRVASLRPASPSEAGDLPRDGNYQIRVASCDNGRRFVVASPVRRPGPPQPNQPTQWHVRPAR